MEALDWIQSTGLATWIRESMWGYPIILSGHAIGMAVVVGTVLMIDIRVLGYASRIPIFALERLFVVARAGVVVNVVSGILLFTTEAVSFTANVAFQIKIALIIAGALSVWLLLRMTRDAAGGQTAAGPKAKATAFVSILFWLGTIVAGRLTAYV